MTGSRDPSTPGTPQSYDDLREHLTETYAPLVAALATHGLSAQVSRGGTGHYLLTIQADGTRWEITHNGRPLPSAWQDVQAWRVSGPGVTVAVAAGAPEQVADTMAAVMAAATAGGDR